MPKDDRPREEREPQSYGSNKEWLTGHTGEKLPEKDGIANETERKFYEPERESEHSHGTQGGMVAEETLETAAEQPVENAHEAPVTGTATQKISSQLGDEKEGYFKKRDYPDE
jgi:hypothetical protein